MRLLLLLLFILKAEAKPLLLIWSRPRPRLVGESSRVIIPDKGVAYGSAVQDGVITDEKDIEVVLLNVNPLSMGIETVGGAMTKFIPRNSVIPIKKSQIFSTAADNQTTVTIKAFKGERPMTKDNYKIGEFRLTDIPPAPRGVPQIEVTFEVDAKKIIHVTVEDKGIGKKNKMSIRDDSLYPEDVKRMINDAEKFADEDKKVKELVEARNEIE